MHHFLYDGFGEIRKSAQSWSLYKGICQETLKPLASRSDKKVNVHILTFQFLVML